MNKRLLCLLLCLIMLVSVAFTSCAKKTDEESAENINEQASKNTVTLSLYLMSDHEISEEQAQKIEDAANKITKSKFKAKLDIRYFTEEQYSAALAEAFEKTDDEIAAKKAAEQALKEAIKRGEATTTAATSSEATEEETVITEFGTTELKYPSISDHQIDIFYVNGFDALMSYVSSNRLAPMDEQFTGYAKLLNDYLVSDYLEHAKSVVGGTYMIPSAKPMGEYTYLLLKKDILKKYSYSATRDSFTSITCDSVKDILNNVSKYDTQYVPLKSEIDALEFSNIAYIGFDANGRFSHNNFSVIGGDYDPSYKFGVEGNVYGVYDETGKISANIFDNSEFELQMKTYFEYKEKNYYASENDTRPFAVGLVKGDGTLPEKYADEYEVVVVKNPQITSEDVFASGFAIGKNTSDLGRSMEIITYLNTNEDFRNLLLYGIEGENYELVITEVGDIEYKTVKILNKDYDMSPEDYPERTGNVMITYPIDGAQRLDIREFQKVQNRDADPILDFGFYHIYSGETVNLKAMEHVRKYSEQVYSRILACETYADYEALKATVKEEMSEDPIITLMMDATYSTKSKAYVEKSKEYGNGCSILYLYDKWLTDKKFYVPPKND